MTAPDLVGIFTDPIFDRPDGLTANERHELTYRRLRHIHRRLGTTGPLLSDPARLGPLLELTAMVDPGLFQVLFLHHCMAIGAVLDYGRPDATGSGTAAGLIAGRAVGAALMTELGHGNSIPHLRTQASYDPRTREFVLHTPGPDAAKFPPNVGAHGVPRSGVVGARLTVAGVDRGVFLFLVRLRDADGPCPGVHIRPLPETSLHALDYAGVRFDQVRVPYGDWLRDGAEIAADGTLDDPVGSAAERTRRSAGLSRFACGAVSLGLGAVARAAVAIALTHAQRRSATDRGGVSRPVFAYRNQQRLLLGALASAHAATVVARRATAACWRLAAGPGQPAAPAQTVAVPPVAALLTAGLTKVATDRLADRAVAQCRQATGSLGFLSVNRIIDYQGLTLAFNSAGGDNQMVLLEAAWSMANGLDYEAPPLSRPAQFGSAPSDRPEWISLLQAREHLLHRELTGRLAAASGDLSDAWDAETGRAQRLAEAHIATMVVTAVHEDAQKRDGTALAGVAHDLCRILFLTEVSADAGWFLASGHITAEDVATLTDHLDDAVVSLAPHIDDLAGILDVPVHILRAVTAAGDYVTALAP